MTVRSKFLKTRAELAAALVERDEEIDLALTALVAKQHLLLVGPPGCAKSMLLDSLMKWAGGNKFAVLLNKYTVPEEVVGPVSVVGLKDDRFVRITTGKLPEADWAFLDEVFKASSAILNTLLRILNERTFDAGDGVARKCPLKLCVAASNEWPNPETGKELSALFDRFTLRRSVRPIATQDGERRLLWDGDLTPELSTSVTPAEIEEAAYEAAGLKWSAAAREAMETVLRELRKEGVQPGDRRKLRAVQVAKAFAWLSGADLVQPDHLEILAAVLWDDPVEQPAVCSRVIAKIANPVGMRVNAALLETEQIINGTDPRKLDEAAKAAAKLGEIDKGLAPLAGNNRADKARRYVAEKMKALKLAAVDGF
jgi:MoxR-like ATPase